MKKTLSILVLAALLVALAASALATAAPALTTGNYTDEMKIPHAIDLSEPDGADSIERQGDHPGSPYFAQLDFYNMESTDTLTILPHFKTQQQSSEWSCGPAAALMVLNYFDKLGDHNEETLAAYRSLSPSTNREGTTPSATTLRQMMDIFEGVGGFTLESTFEYLAEEKPFWLNTIQDYLAEGLPVLIGWNDWGGHWQVIIGYDTMGTESELDDVLIVTDPYDTNDHNQDGYGVYQASRFIYNFTFYNMFKEEDLNDMVFLVVRPEA